MARYDLMHWSQRVRDQQAAARAAQLPPSVLPTPVRHPAKPRASRPKPPRDEEAEQLLRLCREGRLFELQAWVAAGKSLSVPAHYRQTPMRIALNTGFHSLIEFLLRHEENQSAKDEVLKGMLVDSVPLQLARTTVRVSAACRSGVIETWDRGVAPIPRTWCRRSRTPRSRAFKARVKAVSGSFSTAGVRPELAEALQLQADMALRQACQDEISSGSACSCGWGQSAGKGAGDRRP
jgi:hypothetical protein